VDYFIKLRIETSGEEFGIYSVAERLLASQEGLCHMKIVNLAYMNYYRGL
jgi:hypothetical protein